MRGRRAFVILSLYLLLLGGFAWMVELIMERTYSTGFGGGSAFATAAIGQGIFAALLMLETLLVVFLAPMSTVGADQPRAREADARDARRHADHAPPPSSSASCVSALVYVWLLIAASIPLTAVVFVFGGVAPEDLVRGYLVLVVTALGFGAFGLFCSSIVKRTQAATAITIFGVLAAVDRDALRHRVLAGAGDPDRPCSRVAPVSAQPPGPIAYLNPFLAQAEIAPTDALCGSDNSLRYYCRFRDTFVSNQNGVIFVNGAGNSGGGVVIDGGIAIPVPAGRRVPRTSIGKGGVARPAAGAGRRPDGRCRPVRASTDTIWTKTVVGLADPVGGLPRPVGPVRLADAALAAPARPAGDRGSRLMSRRAAVARHVGPARRTATHRRSCRRIRSPSLDGPLDPELLAVRRRAAAAPRPTVAAPARPPRRGSRSPRSSSRSSSCGRVARFVPLPSAPVIGAASRSSARSPGSSPASAHDRRLGETALAVDAEAGLGDRVSSALELAVAFPASAGPATEPDATDTTPDDGAARRGRRDRSVRPAAARATPWPPFAWRRGRCSGRGSRAGRRASRSSRCCSSRRSSSSRTRRTRSSPSSSRSARRPSDRRRRSTGSRRSSRTRARTRTTRGRGWRRSCVTWRSSSASARTTSTSISPGSARSRPRSAPRSIRRTSSGPRP